MTKVELFFDGASRGNPGSAGAGAYLILPKTEKKELFKGLGEATNNQAEYSAIVLGLNYLLTEYNNLDTITDITIKGDSQLVIKQLQGQWRVKSGNIRKLSQEAKNKVEELESRGITVTLQYIPRDKNSKADNLANKGADEN